MKPLFLTVSLAALVAAAPAFAQSTKSSSDRQFVERVAQDNQAEVELGQLAQQKSSNTNVKALGQRLAADHSKANQQLSQIAQKEGVKLPSDIGRENKTMHERLAKLSGPAFDRAFVQAQVEDHQKEIQYLQRQEASVQDPNLKSFIQQSLPVMQQHLQMAQQIENQMTGSGSSRAK